MTPDKVEAALGVLSAIVDKTNWQPDIDAGNEAISVLTEALAERGWRPIESAPRDGTIVDLWAVSLGLESRDSDSLRPYVSFRVCDAGWYDGEWRNSDGNSLDLEGFTNIVFTHWQPLPEPPHDR